MYLINSTTGMNRLKIVAASTAYIPRFKTQNKANTFFNQECLRRTIIQNFAEVKIPITSAAAKFTCKKYSF